jgi:hypothetical protein
MTTHPVGGDPADPDAGGGRPPPAAPGGPMGAREPDPAPARPAEERPRAMIPARARRRTKVERGSMRVLATGGIVGLSTAVGAILVGQDVAGWIVGLTLGLLSVILAAILWSSRQL